jgi:hypothetical protein
VPALLVNIRIDSEEKLEFFKVTFADIAALFDEWHVKVRGKRGQECVDFARQCAGDALRDYQGLQQEDWVAATLEMVRQVKALSVFIYFEDHRLVAKRDELQRTLRAFDESGLDYLCYSFFQASQLESRNLLPLAPKAHAEFDSFALDARTRDLVGRISPNYYTFSLLSIASVEYFTAMLASENHRRKVYSRLLLAVLTRAFRYPAYRKAYAWLNSLVAQLGFALTIYEPSSPFNLEKLWHESVLGPRGWKFGIPKRELFANYDDDNGAYGESLIKKGMYPLRPEEFDPGRIAATRGVAYPVDLEPGIPLDCTYHSHNTRIRHAPVVEISVKAGSVDVSCKDSRTRLGAGESRCFYSNLGPVIHCGAPAKVQLRVLDEVFE